MRSRREIRIPKFMEQPQATNPAGFAARAMFLRNIATAWQQAGDQATASKILRDADNQAGHPVSADLS